MNLDGLALDENRLEGLDPETVQRRRPVQQHRMLLDHFTENVPDLGALTFHHALGGLDVLREVEVDQTSRLNNSNAMILGRPHWCSLSWGPTTMTERPE